MAWPVRSAAAQVRWRPAPCRNPGHAAEGALEDPPVSVRENGTPNARARRRPPWRCAPDIRIASGCPASRILDGGVHVQRQVVSGMLPSEAKMPPCAATVCERVGNPLVMQAV